MLNRRGFLAALVAPFISRLAKLWPWQRNNAAACIAAQIEIVRPAMEDMFNPGKGTRAVILSHPLVEITPELWARIESMAPVSSKPIRVPLQPFPYA